MSRRNQRICFRTHTVALAPFAIGIMILFANGMAGAKTPPPLALCVNHSGLSGCSTTIQGAVDMVPAGGKAIITIAADVTPYTEDVTVTDATISFVGGGAGMTVVDGTNVSSLPTFQFNTNSNGEFHGMTIENGNGGQGSNISFIQFATKGSHGVGTLVIENCLITGGVRPSNILPEGAVNFVGKKLVIDSTSITDNVDQGLFISGVPHAFITNTTISGNDTSGNHGNAVGCGIKVSSGTVVLNNVTITDNHCVGGSGMGQSPTQGGGLWTDFPVHLSMSNTMIANNTVAGSLPSGPDCFVPGTGVKSKGFNLIKDISQCNIKLAKSDITDADPNLASLSACATSGLLVTPPLAGSPLLDAGNPKSPTGKLGTARTTCLPLDECGGARAKGQCAIGASQ